MGMQLNIKSDDAYTMATQLSELTGESLTTAVTTALRERLERERKSRDVQARVERVMALAKEIRAHMKEPTSSDDHNELYGEDGLPA